MVSRVIKNPKTPALTFQFSPNYPKLRICNCTVIWRNREKTSVFCGLSHLFLKQKEISETRDFKWWPAQSVEMGPFCF